ncbi:MAG: DEAD/DEAH box helicase [Ideonella sp.]|nr:DEAD/DEAH box helicase [Ideonella sp.]MCC7458622.1 DEAD/DEAH box helicase [Nitrospira sp.]
MSFESLNLHPALAAAVRDAGYTVATEVQQRTIPPALEGRDLMVSSSTGSGKTAAFVLPALARVLAARNAAAQRPASDEAPAISLAHHIDAPRTKPARSQARGPRVLVLVPTRELAIQVSKAALGYGRHVRGLRVVTVVGGVPYGVQLRQLSGALDLLIATPGRLMDHMQSGKAVLSNVELLVLDEADRMLDMGFIDDIQFIGQALPRERQTVMTSATFGGHVGRLAQTLLREPQRIDVASHTDTHADIEQRLHWADDLQHKNALLDHLLTDRNVDQALVFTSTQRDADQLADRLAELGHRVASLHGGMPQRRRNRVLTGLRKRDLRVLVATDVAARGIDVPSISHVINYGLPMKAEDYVHRIGRTGRAGRAGLAVTLAERRDAAMIHHIQRFTTQRIPTAVVEGLEPKRPEPKSQTQPLGRKPAGHKPGRRPGFAGKPGFGQKAIGKKAFGQKKPLGGGVQSARVAPRDRRPG